MNLSLLLPARRWTFETSMTPEQVAQTLRAQVGKRSWSAAMGIPTQAEPPYRGSVELAGFQILRNLSYRNSFQPVTSGKVEPAPFGARIRVSLRLMLPVLLFMTIWMTGATLGTLAVVVSMIGGSTGPGPQLLIILMPLAGFAMTSGGFAFEAAKTERFLRELFPPATGTHNAGPYRDAGS